MATLFSLSDGRTGEVGRICKEGCFTLLQADREIFSL